MTQVSFTPQAACTACSTPKLPCRYYGTGECFVFQLQPQRLMWKWWQRKNEQKRNDFFQFSTGEALCMGGAPVCALRLDAELDRGVSGISETFGSPCLAGSQDFIIGKVELWALD